MENSSLIFFGVIDIIDINNVGTDGETKSQESDKSLLLTTKNVKTVHYPDCQQLILWLPQYFREYKNVLIRNIEENVIIFDHKVGDIINGSIQILIDTLFIYPGTYELTINKNNGLVHVVRFKKYPEGEWPVVPEITPSEPIDLDNEPTVYRDGFGNIIPNEDLILREKIIKKTINKITRHLEYISQGRDGEVIYIEGEKRIKFLMEMGAYECVFYVNIPSAFEWETITKFPLDERDDIIAFVAEQTHRDQAPSCVYKIADREITYFKKKVK